MDSRKRNVLLGAIATGGLALSLPAGRVLGNCLRQSCDLTASLSDITAILLSVSTTLLVFQVGARIGRIRSGWLAALLVCASFGWLDEPIEAPLPLLLTFAITLGGAVALLRSFPNEPGLSPRASELLLGAIVLVALLGSTGATILTIVSDDSRHGTISDPLILPWGLALLAVFYWTKDREQRPPALGFLISWTLLALCGSLLATLLFWPTQPIYLFLPVVPPLALIAGLTLGPGPDGEFPRRMVRLNFEIAGAFGLFLAFLLLTAMVAPLETALPDDLVGFWNARFAGLRAHGAMTMILGFGVLAVSTAIILQARGAHWFRASLPLALLITLLHMILG